VIELVHGIILDEKFEAAQAIFFGGALAQGAGDQVWSSLPDVTEKLSRAEVERCLVLPGPALTARARSSFEINQRARRDRKSARALRKNGPMVPSWNVVRPPWNIDCNILVCVLLALSPREVLHRVSALLENVFLTGGSANGRDFSVSSVPVQRGSRGAGKGTDASRMTRLRRRWRKNMPQRAV